MPAELKEELKIKAEEPKAQDKTMPLPKTGPKRLVVGLWIAILILAAGVGVLGWQFFEKSDTNKEQSVQIQNLEDELVGVQDELASLQELYGADATPTPTIADATLTENIEAALNTMNTAALEGYMADSVYVVYAATEYAGNRTPAEAVADLSYLESANAPWDFSLPVALLHQFETGFYTDYFDADSIVGKSANDYVVSFNTNADGNIDGIFIAADVDLLL